MSPDMQKWSTGSIVYQIYPRSFKDSNGDGVGDLRGIIEKLDYLNDDTDNSLGIDAIWLSPIYQSPMKDFGYDISDYCNIESMFGNLSDFDRFVQEAHNRRIKVMMDYIPGHTSDMHTWFLESRSSRDNPKRDWYIWKDPKPDGSPPNNWLSVFGGSRWEWDEKTRQYYMHTWTKEQPDLNWRNEELKEQMLNVLHFWLKRGVDGFRVDAFEHLIKHAEFLDQPDNPDYKHGVENPFDMHLPIYTRHQPELQDMVRLFSSVLSEYGDKFMVTESWADLTELVRLYQAGDTSHAPFNFQFLSLMWDAKLYKKFIDTFDVTVGETYIPTYVLGNHDRSRVATRIGKEAARVAAMLQLTLRGMPTIYYGEELGMEDVVIPPHRIQDPFEKNIPGLKLGRDPQRTPMQWDDSLNAGFSPTDPWLPLAEDYKRKNVKAQQKDPTSMLSLYKKIIDHRQHGNALSFGKYTSLDITNDYMLGYIRQFHQEKVLVLLNFSDHEQTTTLEGFHGKMLVNTKMDIEEGKEINLSPVTLRPHEGYMIDLQ